MEETSFSIDARGEVHPILEAAKVEAHEHQVQTAFAERVNLTRQVPLDVATLHTQVLHEHLLRALGGEQAVLRARVDLCERVEKFLEENPIDPMLRASQRGLSIAAPGMTGGR